MKLALLNQVRHIPAHLELWIGDNEEVAPFLPNTASVLSARYAESAAKFEAFCASEDAGGEAAQRVSVRGNIGRVAGSSIIAASAIDVLTAIPRLFLGNPIGCSRLLTPQDALVVDVRGTHSWRDEMTQAAHIKDESAAFVGLLPLAVNGLKKLGVAVGSMLGINAGTSRMYRWSIK